jgi:hypothetical protein
MPSVNEVEEAAADQAGLSDFGTDSYREGLGLLLKSLGAEARLNARGEAFIYQRIIGYLGQRLQVEDWYRRHPEIDERPIVAPLIGLGLPRTGSTALSMLLAQDPGVRYLRKWESSQPCPPPSTAPWLTRLQALGEDVSLVLETDSGTVQIEGETVFSTHDIHHNDDTYSVHAMRNEIPNFPALQQAGVRYRWDGEETYGMLERSNPLDKISR